MSYNVINSEVANVHAAGVVVVSKGSVPMNLVPRSLGGAGGAGA